MISSTECFETIKDFCKINNAEIEIEEAESCQSFLMMYSISRNKLFYNLESLIRNYKRFAFPISIKEFVLVALCHELGHYNSIRVSPKGVPVFLKEYFNDDFSFKKPENTPINSIRFYAMNNELEKLAWEFGLKYIPFNLIEVYRKLSGMYGYILD